MERLYAEISNIIKEFSENVPKIEGDISLIEDLELDSLQLVAVLAEIEEQYHLSMEEGEHLLEYVDHFEELVDYIFRVTNG